MSETQQNVEQVETVSIPLSLLVDMKTVIEVTSTRGAYKADELQPVGTIYNTVQSILEPYIQDDDEAVTTDEVEEA